MAAQRRVSFGWLSALVLSGLFAFQSASATFGGDNGEAVYSYFDSNAFAAGYTQEALFATDGRQLTVPVIGSGERDLNAVFSPDGKQIAFIVKRNSVYDSIDIMAADGTGRHTVLSADTIASTAGLFSLTWLANGHQLAVSVVNVIGGSYGAGGIWLLESDGSNSNQIVANGTSSEQAIFEVDGSPIDDAVAYRCRYRAVPGSLFLRDDLCIVDPTGGVQRLPIELPDTPSYSQLGPVHFAADGLSLVFTALYVSSDAVQYDFPSPWDPSQSVCSGTVHYQHDEIYRINRDGTGAQAITRSAAVKVFSFDGSNLACGVSAQQVFTDAVLSPRGDMIIAYGTQAYASGDSVFGLWQVDPISGYSQLLRQMPLGALLGRSYPSWQPEPQGLAVTIEDGHGDLLDGLKVELRRRSDGVLLDNAPVNSGNGRYVFEKPVAAGDYTLRAILTDNCRTAGCTPAFDIRYAPEAAEPVRIDWKITVTAANPQLFLAFESPSDPATIDSNVSTDARDRLDDMAAIYFQLRRYVLWAKNKFTLDAVPTVQLHAFATLDPLSGTPIKYDGYYIPGASLIVLGEKRSVYEDRDGLSDAGSAHDAPANAEWHEYSHHLYYTFISQDPCAGDSAHQGYNNKDTCESFDEGFAEFLPVVAAQDLDAETHANYDSMINIEQNIRAWWVSSEMGPIEDFAIAALLWDLTDATADAENGVVIGADGQAHDVTYHDFTSMSVKSLWDLIASRHVKTVTELRAALGQTQPLSIDLDGDGLSDISLIDEPFLMHGFYPVDTPNPSPTQYGQNRQAYDVNYAQSHNPQALRDGAVGDTSHRVFNASNGLINEFIPRADAPHDAHAWVAVSVLDSSGASLPHAVLHLNFHYPNGSSSTTDLRLATGDTLAYVQLPPYFDSLLPQGASLPDCNPASDLHADVTLTAEFNGTMSLESPMIDNCTWMHAVAAATSQAALSFTLHVPVVGGPLQHTLALDVAGTGGGSVSGAGKYIDGQIAAVSAVPRSDSNFTGWTGPNAAECATGVVLMTADKSCTATMTLKPVTQVQVPNVVGLSQAAAAAAISNAGLTLGTTTTQSSTTIAAGNVTAESPAAGQTVTIQSPVNLVVATNPMVCDANNDKRVDLRDIAAILLAWNKRANGAYDPRDSDRSGTINARDTARCLTMCTSFLCLAR